MNKIALSILLTFSTFFAQSQELIEWGVTLNSANYVGDLKETLKERGNIGNYAGYYLKNSGLSVGGFYRKNISESFSFRAGLNWARFSGSDADALSATNKARNLSFRNDILELSALGELNLRPLGFDAYSFSSTPYLFGGIAIFHMNPKANYQGKWYDLQVLGTEGQNQTQYPDKKVYSLTQVAIPLGIGYKFSPSSKVRIGIEAGYRITFTDYLDDVSGTYADPALLYVTKGQIASALSDRRHEINPSATNSLENQKRGRSISNDGYFFVGITVSKVVWGNNCPKF